MTETDWVRPGVKAVVLQPETRGALKAESVTVDRVLKRDVVLDNGDRFNRDRLQRQIGGSWGLIERLVPEGDQQVGATRALIRQRNAESRAAGAYEDWRRSRSSVSAQKVAEAFKALAELELIPDR